MDARRLILALMLLAPLALSGCLGGGSSEDLAKHVDPGDDVKPGTGGDSERPERRDDARRWHYHNYWGDSPVLTLLNGSVELPVVTTDGIVVAPRTAGAEFTLPHGTIVPPETGELNVTVHFTPTAGLPFTGLNLSWMTAGATEFASRPVEPGDTVSIPVSYDQTDVPHRGSSAWRFRLDARDDGTGLAFANGTAHVEVVARIGRPLLIDPPHFDKWRGRTVLPLAAGNTTATVVKLADDRYVDAAEDGAEVRTSLAEVRLPNGSLVPIGSAAVVVTVTWNATEGSAPLGLAYEELNRPSNGTVDPDVDEPGRRVFRIPIQGGMTDSPYANQSTWRFFILVDGPPASAFSGEVTLTAWAERART